MTKVFATHNRAGEVLYCHISGLKYGITIITYTKASSCAADRCELEIKFGDGAIDTISRINGTNCPAGCGSCPKCGEIVGNDIKKNIYYTEHTYSGIGTYIISVEDPTRNADVQNIPSSVDITFYIESELVIFPGGGSNCSPILNFPPIDNGCAGLKYEHNPGAVDPDGDSLVFSITECKGTGGGAIPGFVQPNLVPGGCSFGTLTIDSHTGLLEWNYPQCQGEFNLAILIEEYRNGFKIGSVLRDMQITIISPCPNHPPQIDPLDPICVLAGETIRDTIVARDQDFDQIISLSASGEPLDLAFMPATFNNVQGSDSVFSEFIWHTDCEHIRHANYQMSYKAKDNHPLIPLVDYESQQISVISPASDITSVSSLGNTITIDWDPAFCPNASCYNVYRRIDSSGYVPDSCDTGVPSSAGYQFITNINDISNSNFVDTDPTLVHGQKYCYLITSCFTDGAESQASNEVCIELKRDVPLITHVSISETDVATGKDTVRWVKPTELDTLNYPPPYVYKVWYEDGFGTPTQLAYTSPNYSFLYLSDTVFIHDNINTQASPENYKIEIYYDTNKLVGASDEASSVFLSSTPTDNMLNLSWEARVPWTNYKYLIYKKNTLGIFDFLDSTQTTNYSDDSLVNGQEYCYYVIGYGEYSNPDIAKPLINYSQIHCNIPIDNVAPCNPNMDSVTSSCENFYIQLYWSKQDSLCSSDVVKYYVYRSEQYGLPYQRVDSVLLSADTTYMFIDSLSIAGCYKMTAVDTFYNESPYSDSICIDNCPLYTLPNVFSPGQDGFNDLFKPFPYRYVDSIDLQIFSRWGNRVFESHDPKILWDGTRHGKALSAGVYFYTCDVYFKSINGLQKETLKGTVQMIPESNTSIRP